MIEEKELRRLYGREKLSAADIGKIYNVNEATIRYWMRKYNIPRRDKHTEITKRKIRSKLKGVTLVDKYGEKKAEEMKRKQSERLKGEKHFFFGKHHTIKTKEKISKTKKKLFKEGKLKVWNKGKKGLQQAYNKGKKWEEWLPIEMQKKALKNLEKGRGYFKGKHLPQKIRDKLSKVKKGKHYSPKTEFKKGHIPRTKFMKGHTPWNKNRKIHLSPKTEFTSERVKEMWKDPHHRLKIQQYMLRPEIREKHSQIIKKLHKDPKFQSKRLRGVLKKPTRPEQKLMDIIKKYDLPFKYVGNGEIIIHGLNPDFIECNGRKQIIEVFGDYWHKERTKNIPVYHTEKGRKAIFANYGYKTLIIWEHELKTNQYGRALSEEGIVNKISNFIKS